MAPTTVQQVLLSPAELSYLHTSLSLSPPIRPDSRLPTQFRPLSAETDILPGTNGSARITFADGTEAIVGIKAEVEKSTQKYSGYTSRTEDTGHVRDDEEGRYGDNKWLEMSIEVPGFRDDDAMPVLLTSVLTEALLADSSFTRRLWINRRFHWKLYIDVLLLSPPLSYPLPLLSLTTYLALLSTRLPRLKSEKDEDPLFDDDWDASVPLYPRSALSTAPSTTSSPQAHTTFTSRPPITLLVMSCGENILFDPSKEELSVADVVLAISIASLPSSSKDGDNDESMDVDSDSPQRTLRLLSVRTIDPPSRLTPPGVPNYLNTATGGSADASSVEATSAAGEVEAEGVWHAPRGGAKRKLVSRMVAAALAEGGVADEVLDGLEGVEVGLV